MRISAPPPTRFAGHLPPTGGGKKLGSPYRGELSPPQAVTEGAGKAGAHCAPLQRLSAAVCLFALLFSLTSCAPKMEPTTTTIFAMDTVMNLTVYGEGTSAYAGDKALDMMALTLHDMEKTLSVTKENSDIHSINANCGKKVTVRPETAEVIEQTLALCEKTGGALDVTAYPAVKAWGFTTGEHRVPDSAELAELAQAIDYTRITRNGNEVTLPEGMAMDLGAVAKGYAGDVLSDGLREMGFTSALLDLGQSTIAAIGAKPDGSPFRIGIQDPAGTDYLGVLELADQSMGSSGNYQRYFEQDGKVYGHILDPDTAAPVENGLAGVTVVADSALTCDGLSTALFVMGLEEGAAFWREHRDFEAIFIEENGNITITAGLRENFSLREGYTDREVTVLE